MYENEHLGVHEDVAGGLPVAVADHILFIWLYQKVALVDLSNEYVTEEKVEYVVEEG